MCVAAFPVPGCGSIKTDLLLCWVPLCLGNWLEVSISVFLFQWMAFTDLLSGPWEPFGAPWHISAPSAISPCTSEMPQPCPAMGTTGPGLLMPLPDPAPCLCHPWCALGCPQLPQPAPLPRGMLTQPLAGAAMQLCWGKAGSGLSSSTAP